VNVEGGVLKLAGNLYPCILAVSGCSLLIVSISVLWYTAAGEGPFFAAASLCSFAAWLGLYRLKLSAYISKLENQIEDLQSREKSMASVIYAFRDAVIVVDESDRLLMANEAAGRLFGFNPADSSCKSICELLAGAGNGWERFADFIRDRKNIARKAVNRVLEFSGDGVNFCGSSTVAGARVFECNLSRIASYDKRRSAVVAVLHDITREKEISRRKDDLVSNVSHELKTPLASITAYSEMLLDDEAKDSVTKREFYSIIRNQAKRLSRLIEDVLNTSRIESGLVRAEKEPVSLADMADEQVEMISGYAEENGIRIIVDRPGVPCMVYADRDMISQVMVNLLGNAVKYTHGGGSITVKTEVDESAGLVRVSVTDTGIGIDKSEMKYVFDKFYRARTAKNKAGGTGLGLNIVKQVIEKVHNGRVFAASEPGRGSTFGFELSLVTDAVAETVR